LRAELFDVFDCVVVGVGVGAQCMVFGRQTKSVKAERMKDLIAGHAFKPRERVACRIVEIVPNVERRPAWVRKHLKGVILGFVAVWAVLVCLVLCPKLLPFFVNCRIVHTQIISNPHFIGKSV
jgi:hypothetical protein